MSSPERHGFDFEAWEYEVFLNFRGKDTRSTFTDTLFHYLDQLGIQTFLDDNDLRHGDQIGSTLFKGVKKSKIFVPIFSTNYAESKWCLKELALRVKHNKENIRPFFYDVEPFVVKHQSGSYQEAFNLHENDPSLDKDTIQEWRRALTFVGITFVGNIKGWEVPKTENGRHGAIARKFTSEVFRELNKFLSLDVTEYLVGFDDQVAEVMNLIDLTTEGVLIVGICGLGGIGKTALAKVIYNKILENFDHHGFLADVVEKSRRHGVAELKGQLIAKLLLVKELDVLDADKEIKNRFYNKKVLIFLDDVDSSNKISDLIKSPKYFGSGSRIIITTRNKEIFGQFQESRIHEVEELDLSSSLELFNNHAFKGGKISKEFLDLSKLFVRTLGGLPLSIEIIGSRLHRKPIRIWNDTLKRLRSSPIKEVTERLRLSYDLLEDPEKEIFLELHVSSLDMIKTL